MNKYIAENLNVLKAHNGQFRASPIPAIKGTEYFIILRKELAYFQRRGKVSKNTTFTLTKTISHVCVVTLVVKGYLNYKLGNQVISLNTKKANSGAIYQIKEALPCTFYLKKGQEIDELSFFIDSNFILSEFDSLTTMQSILFSILFSNKTKPIYFQISPFLHSLVHQLTLFQQDQVLHPTLNRIQQEIICLNIVLEIFSSIARKQIYLNNADKDRNTLDKMKDLIKNHRADKWTVQKIANECGTNSTTLQAISKKYTGKTVIALRQSLKLEEAYQLLLTGARVKDVALICGYSQSESFSPAFKRYFGFTPNSLQK